MTEDDLIDREAKRRCKERDFPLSRLAYDDRRFRHDDTRPWWQAALVPQIKAEIERVRKAGFSVTSPSLIEEHNDARN
jgi:hypothetical protein